MKDIDNGLVVIPRKRCIRLLPRLSGFVR